MFTKLFALTVLALGLLVQVVPAELPPPQCDPYGGPVCPK